VRDVNEKPKIHPKCNQSHPQIGSSVELTETIFKGLRGMLILR